MPHLSIEGVYIALHEHVGQDQVLEALNAPHHPRLIVTLERLQHEPGSKLRCATYTVQRLSYRAWLPCWRSQLKLKGGAALMLHQDAQGRA